MLRPPGILAPFRVALAASGITLDARLLLSYGRKAHVVLCSLSSRAELCPFGTCFTHQLLSAVSIPCQRKGLPGRQGRLHCKSVFARQEFTANSYRSFRSQRLAGRSSRIVHKLLKLNSLCQLVSNKSARGGCSKCNRAARNMAGNRLVLGQRNPWMLLCLPVDDRMDYETHRRLVLRRQYHAGTCHVVRFCDINL